MRDIPGDISNGGRPLCLACFRPATHCLCQFITSFQAHCNILILQHPAERFKYYSTAKLVTKSITNSKRIRGIVFSADKLPVDLKEQKTYLLYPSKDAIDCENIPLDTKSTVIVVDGTWDEAKKIIYHSPYLKQFQHITFKTPITSNYMIRKQPKDHYLSTIESVGHLLRLNALANGLDLKSKDYDRLFDIFSKMVQQQLAYFPRMRNHTDNPSASCT